MYGYSNGSYGGNPYQPPQIGQLYNATPQYPAQTQGNTGNMQYAYNVQNYQVLRGRPVANFEEANASMIDLDGSTFIFPCEGKKRIYTKQIGLDGNPIIKTYVLEEQGQGQVGFVENRENTEEYVLKSDYEKAIKRLETKVNKLLKGGPKNESNGNDDKGNDEPS